MRRIIQVLRRQELRQERKWERTIVRGFEKSSQQFRTINRPRKSRRAYHKWSQGIRAKAHALLSRKLRFMPEIGTNTKGQQLKVQQLNFWACESRQAEKRRCMRAPTKFITERKWSEIAYKTLSWITTNITTGARTKATLKRDETRKREKVKERRIANETKNFWHFESRPSSQVSGWIIPICIINPPWRTFKNNLIYLVGSLLHPTFLNHSTNFSIDFEK